MSVENLEGFIRKYLLLRDISLKRIDCQEELIKVLKKIKSIAKLSFKSGSNSETKYGLISYHTTINYKGELINIKAPKIIGHFGLAVGRSIVDALFNDYYTIYEFSTSMEREASLYKILSEAGFPTFKPRQDLILDKNGIPYVTGLLLTEKVANPQHTIDFIEKADEIKALDCIANVSELMKKLHKHEIAWGDARLENTLYSDNKLLLYDFGFKPNPKKPLEFLQGKDLVSLCLSAVSITGQNPNEVVPAILDSYQPPSEVREYLNTSLEKEIKKQPIEPIKIIRESLYFQILFGLNNSQVIEIKKEIYKQVS